MSKYIGRLIDLGIARETSRGVGVAPAYWVPQTAFSFDDKVVKARVDSGIGELADSEQAHVTTKYGEGSIEGEIRDRSFGLFLYALLGTLSTSGPSDSLYTHSFTLAESNQHQSLSLTVVDPNTTEMYELAMIDSLEINIELDNVVRYVAEFMGKQATGAATPSITYVNENKFTKSNLLFKVASDLSGIAAASGLSVKRIRLNISKNVVMDDVLGTVEPEDFLNRQVSIEGEVELNYTDETWKNYMKNNTARAMQINLVGDATIGVSAHPELDIKLPNVDFFDWEPDYANDDIVRQTISFKANHDITGGNKMISTCQLKNAVSSY